MASKQASCIALSPALPVELLDYILKHQAYPTTLIICTARARFLDSLLRSIKKSKTSRAEDADAPPSSPPDADFPPSAEPALHPLLIPTLHQIASSRYVDMVFIPTLSHLRAYLSVFSNASSSREKGRPELMTWDKPGRNRPLLVLYGLLDLHRDTSEWSAQGLGSSLAALVEAGTRCGRRIVVLEERCVDSVIDENENEDQGREIIENEEDILNEVSGKMERKLGIWEGWLERVPMLNGSVRRIGFENEDGAWSGRTVEIGRVIGRWFRFGRADWDEGT